MKLTFYAITLILTYKNHRLHYLKFIDQIFNLSMLLLFTLYIIDVILTFWSIFYNQYTIQITLYYYVILYIYIDIISLSCFFVVKKLNRERTFFRKKK